MNQYDSAENDARLLVDVKPGTESHLLCNTNKVALMWKFPFGGIGFVNAL